MSNVYVRLYVENVLRTRENILKYALIKCI